jgi:hypothetical protein
MCKQRGRQQSSTNWAARHRYHPARKQQAGSTLGGMAIIELSERTVARLTVLAQKRGVTPDVIAEEFVTAGLGDPGFDHSPNDEFDALVDSVIADHREILNRLAAT